jgi:hypothetical protein
MPYILVATPSYDSVETFDAVIAKLGEAPEGLLERHVGPATDGRLRVVSVWESKAHADRFHGSGRLGSAIAQVLGPEPAGSPDMLGIEVARSFARQPVG